MKPKRSIRTKKTNCPWLLALAASLLLFPSEGRTQTLLVDWGGNYFATGQATTDITLSTGTAITGGFIYPYSETTPKAPVSNVRFNPAATSAVFYGGYQITSVTPGGEQNRLAYNGGQNELRFLSGINGNTQGLLFWEKDDFLNGYDSQSGLDFNTIGTLSLDVSSVRATDGTARFAVLSDGVWYLSETSQSYTTGSSPVDPGAFALTDLANTQWGAWTITSTTSPLNPEPSTFTTSGGSFTNITAVGLYFDVTYASNNRALLNLRSFEVSAIPEPGTAALALAGSVCFAWVRVRRKRQTQLA